MATDIRPRPGRYWIDLALANAARIDELKAELEGSRKALLLWMHYDDVQTYEAYVPAILATRAIIDPGADVLVPPPLL